MGDQKLREAVDGIDPPDADRHEFYIDIQPVSKPATMRVSFFFRAISITDNMRVTKKKKKCFFVKHFIGKLLDGKHRERE